VCSCPRWSVRAAENIWKLSPEQKKERRLSPPLRCKSVGTPLVVDCRSIPGLSIFDQFLVPCRSALVAGLLPPPLFLDVFQSLRRVLAFTGPAFRLSEAFTSSAFRSSRSAAPSVSFDIPKRLTLGVYLKRSRFPLESPFVVRPFWQSPVWVTYSVPPEYYSVVFHLPLPFGGSAFRLKGFI